MSWNVKQFRGNHHRTRQIIDQIEDLEPDVFGIIEFLAKDQVSTILNDDFFKDYNFAFTDSKEEIEIFIGWKKNKFSQAVFTQRRELQVGKVTMRPGALLSLKETSDSKFTNLLFLHTDSGKEFADFSNRQMMLQKVWDMNNKLTEIQNAPRLVVLGDLNTMGRKKLSVAKPTISKKTEIEDLEAEAEEFGMQVLKKSHDLTYRSLGGSLRGDLDHVIASKDLEFEEFSDPKSPNNPHKIQVKGWIELDGTGQDDFIKFISDHCVIYGEIKN